MRERGHTLSLYCLSRLVNSLPSSSSPIALLGRFSSVNYPPPCSFFLDPGVSPPLLLLAARMGTRTHGRDCSLPVVDTGALRYSISSLSYGESLGSVPPTLFSLVTLMASLVNPWGLVQFIPFVSKLPCLTREPVAVFGHYLLSTEVILRAERDSFYCKANNIATKKILSPSLCPTP